MATVQRANVILQIADDRDLIDKYRAKGYSVLDETGKVVESSTVMSVENLQLVIEQLQKENATLKEELKKATEKKSRTKKTVETDSE